MSTASTDADQKPWLFKPGVSGNPRGRPKGSRNKLTEDFARALSEDFEAHGPSAIETCRLTEPAKYVSIIASLMPKDVTISARPLAQLSEDELRHAIDVLEHLSSAGIPAVRIGTAEARGGDGAHARGDLCQHHP